METKRTDDGGAGAGKSTQDDSKDKHEAGASQSEDKKGPSSFSPEVITTKNGYNGLPISYRFDCPGPGVYQCDLTRMVFVMAKATELRYKLRVWDDNLLFTSRKMAAGPLFDFKSTEDSAVLQLHLPHCETKEALAYDGLMSIVHLTDDGMSILEPVEVNDTHVVVQVPHLASFGLIWDIPKRFVKLSLPVKGQVLLFLRPPYGSYQIIDYIVLQENVPVHLVAVQQKPCELIPISSDCLLTFGHRYSINCEPKPFMMQPEGEEFTSNVGPNFLPSFEVFLTEEMGSVTLSVHNQDKKEIWRQFVFITPLTEQNLQ